MHVWDELVSFIRGTRPPAPLGPRRRLATVLLVTAALVHLPLVYLFVAMPTMPTVTLAVGLVAIGLAWCSGVSLEGRRAGTVRAIAAVGVAEGALAFVPPVAEPLGNARYLFVAIAALCAGSLLRSSDGRE